jgi:hypothetical protein
MKDKIYSLNSRLKRQIAINKLQAKQIDILNRKYQELINLMRTNKTKNNGL